MTWRRFARKVDRFCCWGILVLGAGGSAILDLLGQ